MDEFEKAKQNNISKLWSMLASILSQKNPAIDKVAHFNTLSGLEHSQRFEYIKDVWGMGQSPETASPGSLPYKVNNILIEIDRLEKR